MAQNNTELALLIRTEMDRAIKDVQRFQREVKKNLGDTNQAGAEGTAVFNKFRGALGAVGVGFSLAAVIGQVRAATREAAEAERVEGRLDAVLKATGQSWKFSRAELSAYGEQLAETTRFTDEEAKGAITSLLTFTNIARENFGQTLTVAADLAAVMETDLRGAAEALGKVIANPEEGFGRLGRKVQDLTDAQKDMVKQMVATGNAAGAQQFILEQLTQRVGGAAAGENSGLFKATNDVTKAWDDMLEAFGRTPTVRSGTISVLGAITAALKELGSVATSSAGEMDRLIARHQPRRLSAGQGSSIGGGALDKDRLAEAMREGGFPSVTTGGATASEEFKKALADLERRIALLGKEKAAEQILFEIQKGRYQFLSVAEKARLLATAQQLDAAQAQHERAKLEIQDAEEMKKKWEAYEQSLTQSAERVKDAVDPTREYSRELDLLDQLLARGKISLEQFDAAQVLVLNGLRELRDGTKEVKDEMTIFAEQAARNLQSAFADEFFDILNGKFDDLGTRFSQLLKRMAAELLASQVLKLLQNSLGTSSTTPAAVNHAGGVVGRDGATRQVSPLAFAFAPRLHGGGIAGLRPDEVPTILQKGEVVLPADEVGPPGGAGNVNVVVENSGTPQTVRDTQVTFDPESMVVRILTEDMQRGGPVSGAMGRAFGLRRAGG